MANDSLTADQLAALQEAASCFVTQSDYGAVQLEAVMEKVFGAYTTRQENPIACLWSNYWKTLDVFAELSDTEKQINGMPPVSSYLVHTHSSSNNLADAIGGAHCRI